MKAYPLWKHLPMPETPEGVAEGVVLPGGILGGPMEVELWGCSSCGHYYRASSILTVYWGSPTVAVTLTGEVLAGRCCSPCEACGKTHVGLNTYEKLTSVCDSTECRSVREAAYRARLFEAAVKIPEADYNGPVCDPNTDTYYPSTEALHEACACDDREPPSFVWACHNERVEINAEQIIDDLVEGFDDPNWDPKDSLVEPLVLIDYITAWNEKQSLTKWDCDTTRAVLLEPEPSTPAMETP